MIKYTFLLTSNTFGRTLMVKGEFDGPIGLVQNCGDWWYASPVVTNSNRSLSNSEGGPNRSFRSRQLAVAWLQGIKDVSASWFAEEMKSEP